MPANFDLQLRTRLRLSSDRSFIDHSFGTFLRQISFKQDNEQTAGPPSPPNKENKAALAEAEIQDKKSRRRAYQRNYYLLHQEKAKAYQREYNQKNKKMLRGGKGSTRKLKREIVRLVFNATDFMGAQGEKAWRMLDKILKRERGFTN